MSNFIHGKSKTTEHKIFSGMIERCCNKNGKDYKKYGGRGILICETWLLPAGIGFLNFHNDVGARPSSKHSLGRINNDLGYCKENCRWETAEEQCSNKRSNIFITYKNEKITVTRAAKLCGMKADTVRKRLLLGWTVSAALETKPSFKNKSLMNFVKLQDGWKMEGSV